MDPFTMMAIGGGLGLAKNVLIDQPAAKRQRNLQATIAQYSPWTGMQAQGVQDPSAFGSGLQGATAGVMLAQGMQQAEASKGLKNYFNAAAGAGRSPAAAMGASGMSSGLPSQSFGVLQGNQAPGLNPMFYKQTSPYSLMGGYGY